MFISTEESFSRLCLGHLLDISVNVPWVMGSSHPGLLAYGHLNPEASGLVFHSSWSSEHWLQPWPVCLVSPSSVALHPPEESPGPLLLEKGPALGEGKTE